jgi:hypothetical protein
MAYGKNDPIGNQGFERYGHRGGIAKVTTNYC